MCLFLDLGPVYRRIYFLLPHDKYATYLLDLGKKFLQQARCIQLRDSEREFCLGAICQDQFAVFYWCFCCFLLFILDVL